MTGDPDTSVVAQERFSSRKFILAVFFAFSSTFALFLDKISGDEFRAIILVTLGLYAAGNVGASFVKKG